MITNGFTITEKLSDEAINQIRETAQLLSIDKGELKHGKTVPSSVNTNKVETHPKPKRQGIDESEKSSDGNNESIIDVLDSLIRIFDPDYELEEDMGKHFSISNIFTNFPKAVVYL